MALHRTRYTRVIAVEYDLVAQIINGAQHEKITVVEGAAGEPSPRSR